jgi:hypothetical protein
MAETIRVRDHVRSVIDPDGAVLLDLRAGTYLSLNVVGAEIWTRLEKGLSPGEIAAHLGEAYQLPAQQAEADVRGFLDQLRRRELIDAVD